jgi:hypothetical protein
MFIAKSGKGTKLLFVQQNVFKRLPACGRRFQRNENGGDDSERMAETERGGGEFPALTMFVMLPE